IRHFLRPSLTPIVRTNTARRISWSSRRREENRNSKGAAWGQRTEQRVLVGEMKAAEDSRTPRPRGRRGMRYVATPSWSAAVLCRFDFRSLAGGFANIPNPPPRYLDGYEF